MNETVEALKEEQLAQIEKLGKAVARKRDKAVEGRKASGIESIWDEDTEYYNSIDDLNREQGGYTKSPTTTGGIYKAANNSDDTRCTAFFPLTRQFCDSASARMGDILLPAGDWNFTIKKTPVPEDAANPLAEAGETNELDPDTDKKVEKAETRIHDWLVECQYHSEVRKVLENSVQLGTGILKGPFPKKLKKKVVESEGDDVTLTVTEETAPASKSVSPYDFFPDPECGEDIQDGSYVFERDRLSARQLQDLIGLPGYKKSQIEKVIDEGPGKINYSDTMRLDAYTKDEDLFEVWYGYCTITKEDLDLMSDSECKCADMVSAIVVLVNDSPIKAYIDPIGNGDFPYDVMPWQQVRGVPWGYGVARQGRTPQEMLNASGRALLDNAGLSLGPMLAIVRELIEPADGNWEIKGNKIWWATQESDLKDIRNAIVAFDIPSRQVEITNIITLAKQMMEEATGMFFLMQGQQGSAPDTVGGMELLHRNASAPLRRLARVFDERVTERHIRRYYDYLLVHGEDDEKGDLQIEAIGSTALVEREIQSMQAMVLLQLSRDPSYGLDPEKAMDEVLKAERFVPDKFKMDEEKKKKLTKPSNPQIEVAKIRAQSEADKLENDHWKKKVDTTLEKLRITTDTDRDVEHAKLLQKGADDRHLQTMAQLEVKRELALIEYANKHDMKMRDVEVEMSKVKADLAQTAMKLRTQRELSLSGIGGQVLEPPSEPAGRAPDGEAYQK